MGGYVLPCQLVVEEAAEFVFDFAASVCTPGDDQPFPAIISESNPVSDGAVLITLRAICHFTLCCDPPG